MTIFNVSDPQVTYEPPAGTVLLSYRGSIAHNMYVPKSDPHSIDDIDLIGIVVPEPKHIIGLSEWGSRGTQEVKQGQYDAVHYELRKAVGLLLQGNPNIMSILWTHPVHQIVVEPIGKRLLAQRQMFIGKHAYNSFAGYAHAQLQKMETRDPAELREYVAVTNELKYRGAHPNHKGEHFERPSGEMTGEAINAVSAGTDILIRKLASYQKKGENIGYMGDKRKQLVLDHGYDAKNAAHCIRLLRMCKEFLATGEMEVYRTSDRDELLDIKRGKWTLADVKALASQLFAEIKSARDTSPLPETPDREAAERFVIESYREHLAVPQ